jgi:hypothetical protein
LLRHQRQPGAIGGAIDQAAKDRGDQVEANRAQKLEIGEKSSHRLGQSDAIAGYRPMNMPTGLVNELRRISASSVGNQR